MSSDRQEAELSALGRRLGQVRKERGLPLEAVERETGIRTRYLEPLERGELDAAPNLAWAHTLLTTYATYLGLGGEAAFRRPWRRSEPGRFIRRRWRVLVLGLCLAVLAGIIAAAAVVAPYNGFTRRITGALQGIAPGIFLGNQTQRVLVAGSFDGTASGRDSVVVVRVAEDGLGMLSIPSNTRTTIPGYGTGDVSRAFSMGGPGLASKTTSRLIGAKVPNYVVISAGEVRQVVNDMGGVRFDVPEPVNGRASANGPRVDLSPGVQTLSGEQALVYLKGNSDWSEGKLAGRQQKLLYAMFSQALRPSRLLSHPATLKALLSRTETNMSAIQMLQLASRARALGNSGTRLKSATLPGKEAAGLWTPDQRRLEPVLKQTVR